MSQNHQTSYERTPAGATDRRYQPSQPNAIATAALDAAPTQRTARSTVCPVIAHTNPAIFRITHSAVARVTNATRNAQWLTRAYRSRGSVNSPICSAVVVV